MQSAEKMDRPLRASSACSMRFSRVRIRLSHSRHLCASVQVPRFSGDPRVALYASEHRNPASGHALKKCP